MTGGVDDHNDVLGVVDLLDDVCRTHIEIGEAHNDEWVGSCALHLMDNGFDCDAGERVLFAEEGATAPNGKQFNTVYVSDRAMYEVRFGLIRRTRAKVIRLPLSELSIRSTARCIRAWSGRRFVELHVGKLASDSADLVRRSERFVARVREIQLKPDAVVADGPSRAESSAGVVAQPVKSVGQVKKGIAAGKFIPSRRLNERLSRDQ